MNTGRSHPPALALWFLRRLYPTGNRDAITGDLLERYHEDHSNGWFWHQVLVAILLGTASRLKPQSVEIAFAAAGTALISCFPWGRIVPTALMITSMNWGARLRWVIAIETVTALMVLPIFAALSRRLKTLAWSNLLRMLLTCAVLLTAGDMPAIFWNVRHPDTGGLQAAFAISTMIGCNFVALLLSARTGRPQRSSSKAEQAS